LEQNDLELTAALERTRTLARACALMLALIESMDLDKRTLNTLLEGQRALLEMIAG
jgi:hypothetical protein